MRTHKPQANKRSAFTLVEILIVIAILAILAVVTFVVINPAARINDANDAKRREDVQAILSAMSLYSVDNGGDTPTYDTGDALPTVTTSNIMTTGVNAVLLDGIEPVYLTNIPSDPSGSEYKVGVLASGAVLVGATLSNATVFTVSE